MKFTKIKLDRFNSLQIFQFLRYGSMFLISILLAKIAMYYQYDYGLKLISQFENLMLVSGSFTFFWVSGICNTLIPYYNNSDELTKKKVLFNTFVLLVAFSILAAVATALMGLSEPRDQNLFNMFALVVLLNTPTFLADYIFYLKGKYNALIRWGIITFSAHVFLLCAPLYFHLSLNLAINLLLLLSLVKFNYTIILLMKHSVISVNTRLTMDFMKTAFPLMISIFLAGGMDFINNYIVRFNFTDEEFAMFRYGSKELPIFLILANSLSNVFSGEIARSNNEGKLEEGLFNLKVSSRKLMRSMFPLTILLMFASPYMFRYAYSEQLFEGYKIFNIYLLLIISRMMFPQTVIIGILKNRIFYVSSTNYLIINVLLSFWFMYLFGLVGIAYATAIAFLAEKIMLIIYCRMQGITFDKYTAVYEHIFYSIITVGMYFLSTQVTMPMPF